MTGLSVDPATMRLPVKASTRVYSWHTVYIAHTIETNAVTRKYIRRLDGYCILNFDLVAADRVLISLAFLPIEIQRTAYFG